MGEDTTAYLPIFDPAFNARPLANPPHYDAASTFLLDEPVVDALFGMCKSITDDATLVLPGQFAICQDLLGTLKVHSFGVRSCNDSVLQPPVQYVSLELVSQF